MKHGFDSAPPTFVARALSEVEGCGAGAVQSVLLHKNNKKIVHQKKASIRSINLQKRGERSLLVQRFAKNWSERGSHARKRIELSYFANPVIGKPELP